MLFLSLVPALKKEGLEGRRSLPVRGAHISSKTWSMESISSFWLPSILSWKKPQLLWSCRRMGAVSSSFQVRGPVAFVKWVPWWRQKDR